MKDNDNATVARYRWANGNFTRCCMIAAIFAVVGLLLALAELYFAEPLRELFRFPCLPGWCLLRLFMTSMVIAHGGIVFLPLTNALAYGMVGVVIGLFSRSRRAVIWGGAGVAIVLVLCMLAVPLASFVKHVRSIASLKAAAEKRLREDPSNVQALFWLGNHHFSRTGDLRQAERYFRKLVDLEPLPPLRPYRQPSLLYLALIYQADKQHEKAEEMYARFIDTRPDLEKDSVLVNYNRDYLKR